jgi:hypothetical protein
MISFKELDAVLANKVWEKFAPHHYDFGTTREKLANNSRRYIAVENNVVIGFVAIRVHFGKQTGTRQCWRSHKIAVLPECAARWADVSDAIAQFVVDSGYEYRCTTPIPFAKYREGNPRWQKVSESVERNLSSWLYISDLNPEPTPEPPQHGIVRSSESEPPELKTGMLVRLDNKTYSLEVAIIDPPNPDSEFEVNLPLYLRNHGRN